jgi:hypothetical protein
MSIFDSFRYFVVVAEELQFGGAAERLHMSQSPLSRAIRDIERQLELVLFVRTTRRVELTAAGRALLQGARRALADAAIASAHAQDPLKSRPRLARGEGGRRSWCRVTRASGGVLSTQVEPPCRLRKPDTRLANSSTPRVATQSEPVPC